MSIIADVLADKGGKIHTIGRKETVFDAIAQMSHANVGCLIVLENNNIVGIITERDYLRKIALENRSSRSTSVEEIMTSPVMHARERHTIDKGLGLMTEKRCRHLPVLNDKDELVGLVSIGDLVKHTVAKQEHEIQQLQEYIQGSY